jgi:flavin reductase (DIM6/NTAB) family NADH-FMN oxidoreductase RutF
MAPESTIDAKESLGKALGRIASGVYIVTTRDGSHPHGLMATWISQAAFDPPAVTIAINKERGILAVLKPGMSLTVNVLSAKNMDVFKAFARPAKGDEDDRFSGLKLNDNNGGAPVFADASAYFNCTIKEFFEAGDHLIALCIVKDGALLQPEPDPMVHFRKNGFQY